MIRRIGPDHDTVGLHEVVDCRALFQELRIAHDAEWLCGFGRNHRSHFVGRPNRHGALVDDHGVPRHLASNFARDIEHMLQIGGAVLALWRADGDEHDL